MAPSNFKAFIRRMEQEHAERTANPDAEGESGRSPPSSQDYPPGSMARDLQPSPTPSVYWANESITSQDLLMRGSPDPSGRSPSYRSHTPSYGSPSGRSGRRSATPISPVHSAVVSPSGSPTVSPTLGRRRPPSRLSEGLGQTSAAQHEDTDDPMQEYDRFGSQSPGGYRTQSPPSSFPAATPPSLSSVQDFYLRSQGPTQSLGDRCHQVPQSSQISSMGSFRSQVRNLPTQSQPDGAPWMNPIPWQPSPPEWPPLHQGPSPPTPSPPHTQVGRQDRTPQPSQLSELSGVGSFRSQVRNLPTQSQPDGAPWMNPIAWQPSPPEWPPLHQGPSPPTPSPPRTQVSGNAPSAPTGPSSPPGPVQRPAQGNSTGTRSRLDPNRRLWELRAQELTDEFGTRIADMENSESILAPYPESSPPSRPASPRIPPLPFHPRIPGLRATEWMERAARGPIPVFDIYEEEEDELDLGDENVLRISHDFSTNMTFAVRRHRGPAP